MKYQFQYSVKLQLWYLMIEQYSSNYYVASHSNTLIILIDN